MGRPCTRMGRALKQIKMGTEMSVNARGGPRCKAHLVGSRLKHQSVPDNENISETMRMTDTHCKTCQSNPRTRETERLSLDGGRGVEET